MYTLMRMCVRVGGLADVRKMEVSVSMTTASVIWKCTCEFPFFCIFLPLSFPFIPFLLIVLPSLRHYVYVTVTTRSRK